MLWIMSGTFKFKEQIILISSLPNLIGYILLKLWKTEHNDATVQFRFINIWILGNRTCALKSRLTKNMLSLAFWFWFWSCFCLFVCCCCCLFFCFIIFFLGGCFFFGGGFVCLFVCLFICYVCLFVFCFVLFLCVCFVKKKDETVRVSCIAFRRAMV